MNHTRILAVAACLAALPAVHAAPPLAALDRGNAPLLYVRFLGPEGAKLTFYQGTAAPRTVSVPAVLGFRPGYIHRFKVSNVEGRPGLTLFPTLEVRGSLRLTPEVMPSRFPAPVVLDSRDVERMIAGNMLTKVVYLENPRTAPAESGNRDEPFEYILPADSDLVGEAWNHGRPMLLIRAGDRAVSEEELKAYSVFGTILFPGDRNLAPPARPPMLPFACFLPYDPRLGPAAEEECVRDGGDDGLKAGFDRNGRLFGLEPEDTVAEYSDSRGYRKIVPSNRVCLCVPRYAVLRHEWGLEANRLTVGTLTTRRTDRLMAFEERIFPLLKVQKEFVAGTVGREKPSLMYGQENLGGVARFEGLAGLSAPERILDLSAICREPVQVAPDGKLCLHKWCDRKSAEVGEVATFYLRYTNQGGQPLSDVAITDSLTTRLEYVAGSQKSSRNAVFTTAPNDAGSLILRWEIPGQLMPGESAILSFQARVR